MKRCNECENCRKVEGAKPFQRMLEADARRRLELNSLIVAFQWRKFRRLNPCTRKEEKPK